MSGPRRTVDEAPGRAVTLRLEAALEEAEVSLQHFLAVLMCARLGDAGRTEQTAQEGVESARRLLLLLRASALQAGLTEDDIDHAKNNALLNHRRPE